MEKYIIVKTKQYDIFGYPIETWILAERDENGIYYERKKEANKESALRELEELATKAG